MKSRITKSKDCNKCAFKYHNPSTLRFCYHRIIELSPDSICMLWKKIYKENQVMQMKLIDDRLTESMLMPAHVGDAGIDLYACIHNLEKLFPGEVKKFPSGVKTAIPSGWVGLIFPKSGKGSDGLHLANVTGVIDSTYRGQIFIKVKNNSENQHEMMVVKPMEAVAQMVVVPHYEYEKMIFTDGELSETTRGDNGFNSTKR